MKKLIPVFFVFVLISIILGVYMSVGSQQQMTVILEGNLSHQPVEMVPDKFQDSECGMIIQDLKHTCQVVSADGRTWFFDDLGCLAAWLASRPFKDEAQIWVKDLDADVWIDGRTAWYSRTEETPMSYGFGAYTNFQDGLINFKQMQTYMLRDETMANPMVRKELLDK